MADASRKLSPLESVIATAIDEADRTFGYSSALTRLVDGEHTYTLTIDGEQLEFVDTPEQWALDQYQAEVARRRARHRASKVLAALNSARCGDGDAPRPLAEWAEDDGPVLWWSFPIVEPPYLGTPLDSAWPAHVSHWTRFAVPAEPAPEAAPPDASLGLILDTRGYVAADPARLTARDYEALGRACESCGLGWFIEDGTMRFQPPPDVIEEQALQRAAAAAGEPANPEEVRP